MLLGNIFCCIMQSIILYIPYHRLTVVEVETMRHDQLSAGCEPLSHKEA